MDPVPTTAKDRNSQTTTPARKEAAAVAQDLLQSKHVVADDRVVVTDADGRLIHEQSLLPR
jgi:hypothetical protein